ncbi:MAG: polysaccharide deacetylase family protein [Candidatus Aminicenantes bacterium]|nr:polysaccharide deacetylase family protein [Candidatus Aminicenantes bacterium]
MINLRAKFKGIFSGINPLIPYYHVVSDEKLPHIIHLHPYKNILRFLKDVDYFGQKFKAIGLEDLIDFVYKGNKLKKNSVILTFDDGYVECFSNIAPILEKKGLPAIFFVSSDCVDNKNLCYKNKVSLLVNYLIKNQDKFITDPVCPRAASLETKIKALRQVRYKNRQVLDEMAKINGIDWDEYLKNKKPYLTLKQLEELKKRGFYIGAHGQDHANFNELNLNEQIDQVKESIFFIKKALSIDYALFAFPFYDQGISLDFFRETSGLINLSFGTNGILSDEVKWNLQRINFERSLRPAQEIYLRKVIKKSLYIIKGVNFVKRSGL